MDPILTALLAVSALSAGLLVYPFAIYPLVLALLPKTPPPRTGAAPPPRAALLFAARNEAHDLPRTLQTLAAARAAWPGLDILAWDDASGDATPALLAAAPHVRVATATAPVGKAEGLARLIARTDAELLILMDANTRMPADAPARLAAVFADPAIGAAAARAVPSGPGAAVGRAYWRLEEAIKRLETRSGSTIGCDGALWAIRRRHWPRALAAASDDFRPALQALLDGARVVSVPGVKVGERAVPDRHGFARAARIACGAWHAHRQVAPLLPRLSRLDRFKYVSHKLLRWFAGLWLVLALGAALAAGLWVAPIWTLAGLSALRLALRAAAPRVLLVLRAAAAGFAGTTWGVLRAMRGHDRVVWTPVRGA